MAAEILAGSLGLELYKIDLSSLVSKYIGETEKNLARVFAEAETANTILFFDEADALFGKRSEVRDAHDRYANIEISYLLQRMEAYEGLVILATNLSKNMDEAFIRRLHFVVEFPFPSAADRRRIWDGVWPANTPRCPDLDLDLIARRFEFTGGNIKNIALAAAFMAAADGGTIGLDHLLRATQREYQKLGKVVVGEEFERHVAEPRPQ
jgi:SpoVK/Ycf46/Vps4 family AAA+-type ATPase